MIVKSHKIGSQREREDMCVLLNDTLSIRHIEHAGEKQTVYVMHGRLRGRTATEDRSVEVMLRPSEVLEILGSFDAAKLLRLAAEVKAQRERGQ